MDEILKVVGPFEGGFMLINASDFNAEVHTLFDEQLNDLVEAAEEPVKAPRKARG